MNSQICTVKYLMYIDVVCCLSNINACKIDTHVHLETQILVFIFG